MASPDVASNYLCKLAEPLLLLALLTLWGGQARGHAPPEGLMQQAEAVTGEAGHGLKRLSNETKRGVSESFVLLPTALPLSLAPSLPLSLALGMTGTDTVLSCLKAT